jgi:hypothetical protein
MLRPLAVLVFGLCISTTSGCSSKSSSPSSEPSTSGTGGFNNTGSGGAPGGGVASGSGGVGAGMGGAPAAPGQLVCGGKTCHAGGFCDKNGGCPAFLGDCFGSGDHFDTCNAYCTGHGLACAATACGPDGNAFTGGYTWTGFTQANAASCPTSQAPDRVGVDQCTTVIYLTLSTDYSVRCCCSG